MPMTLVSLSPCGLRARSALVGDCYAIGRAWARLPPGGYCVFADDSARFRDMPMLSGGEGGINANDLGVIVTLRASRAERARWRLLRNRSNPGSTPSRGLLCFC